MPPTARPAVTATSTRPALVMAIPQDRTGRADENATAAPDARTQVRVR